MPNRSHLVAVLTAALALSGVAGASAATKTHTAKVSTHKVAKKTTAAAKKATGAGTVVVHPVGGTVVAEISAFPTGGKGSGTEATCGLWSGQLQADQDAQNDATDKDDVIATTETLNTDINNALDAGCAVIY